MAILATGNTFSTGQQVLASSLNNAVNNATFTSGAVDSVSTQLSGGAIIVRDGGITTAKLADASLTAAKIASSTLASNVEVEAGTDATKIVTPSSGGSVYVKKSGASLTGALEYANPATVASAATTDIGAQATNRVIISGTTTITSLGTTAYAYRLVRFTGSLILTHNATTLILPTAANITTADGDNAAFVSDATGNWTCISYDRVNGHPVGGYAARAWVNFDGTASGTFAGGASTVSRTAGSTTATVTTTNNHGLITGNVVYATSGVVAGAYTVTVTGLKTFTFTTVATTLLSAVSIAFALSSIRAAGNVSSIADHGTGSYTVNFSTPLADSDYAAMITTNSDGGVPINGCSLLTASSVRVTTWTGGGNPIDRSIVCFTATR